MSNPSENRTFLFYSFSRFAAYLLLVHGSPGPRTTAEAANLETKNRKEMTMEQFVFDEKNGLWYELRGDYYYPCLTLPDDREYHIGIWGERHGHYLKQERNPIYEAMLLKGTLYSYLSEINAQAEDMLLRLTEEMACAEGIAEQLKAQDQMLWVQRMNSIRDRATEIINNELIFV